MLALASFTLASLTAASGAFWVSISCLPGGCVQVAHLLLSYMQPHPPQLPTDAPTAPVPKNLKKGALRLFIVLVVVAAIVALLLPKKQVGASQTATPAQPGMPKQAQQAQTDAYKTPAGK